MGFTGVLIVACVAIVVAFAVARLVFGPQGAVLLTGGVGYCFGGPPGAGAGLVAGLVLIGIVELLAIMFEPSSKEP